jgi:hypothetical protein
MVEMAVDNSNAAPKLNTELYSLHSQGAEAVSNLFFGDALALKLIHFI